MTKAICSDPTLAGCSKNDKNVKHLGLDSENYSYCAKASILCCCFSLPLSGSKRERGKLEFSISIPLRQRELKAVHEGYREEEVFSAVMWLQCGRRTRDKSPRGMPGWDGYTLTRSSPDSGRRTSAFL